jgi:polyhydroxyalkanoate synthesis regulator phasin
VQAGDILTEHEAKLFETYEALRDLVSDMVEGGEIPDTAEQYQALVALLLECTDLESKEDDQ